MTSREVAAGRRLACMEAQLQAAALLRTYAPHEPPDVCQHDATVPSTAMRPVDVEPPKLRGCLAIVREIELLLLGRSVPCGGIEDGLPRAGGGGCVGDREPLWGLVGES